MHDVVVVGGGLAGLAISGLLARSGFGVTVVESRERPSRQPNDALRSINLALSARGIRTLDALGLTREALQNAIPMYGRRIHLPDGAEDFQPYDLAGNNAIHSIRRSCLWQLLCAAAKANGADIRFDARCLDVDCDKHLITISDEAGGTSQLTYDALIGCDGTHSAVRRKLVECGWMVEESFPLRHGYVELSIPRKSSAPLERDGLHIWPRDDHLLVALPNTDGSFTATLFFPLEQHLGNALLKPGDTLLSLFRENFPDAIGLIQDLPVALYKNPISRLFATKCRPWSYGGSVLLIGDAAHSMAPFYGQGMNCALEDCWALMRSIERFNGNWPEVFSDFEHSRRPEAEAIMILSEANYSEMSHQVAQSDFKLRREIERSLQIRFPSTFVPLYAMVSFSTRPYSEVLHRSAAQARIVDRLAMGLAGIACLNLEADWLKNALKIGLEEVGSSSSRLLSCSCKAMHD
jgi:kynurenine 3-monooxygenase